MLLLAVSCGIFLGTVLGLGSVLGFGSVLGSDMLF